MRKRAACAGARASRESFVKETGTRNGAYGADKSGFSGVKALYWN
jgi:hypothetical protein